MYHMSVSKFMQKVQRHAFFICSVASQKKVLAKNIRKTSANGSVQREGMTDRYDEAFGRYVRTGGMPGSYVYKTEDRQYDYKGVQVVDICRWLRE